MRVDTQVSKWGNSLAVRIPHAVVKEARLAEGDRLTLGVMDDGSLLLRPSRPRYELQHLVSRISPKNRHSETDWGAPVGQESW